MTGKVRSGVRVTFVKIKSPGEACVYWKIGSSVEGAEEIKSGEENKVGALIYKLSSVIL